MINIENVYVRIIKDDTADEAIEKIVTLGNENKLKVGDVIWVKGTILDIDDSDENMYHVEFENDNMSVWLNKNISFKKEEEI